MEGLEEGVLRRVRRWMGIGLPLVTVDAVLHAFEVGHDVSVAVLPVLWCVCGFAGMRRRPFVVAELAFVPVMFVLLGLGAMGMFCISLMGLASRSPRLVPAAARAVVLTLPCAFLLAVRDQLERLPISEITLVLPAAVMFTLGRLVRSNAATAVRAEALAAQLHAANEELGRNLVDAKELAASRERTRIARDLHDSLGHCLTAAHAHLQLASRAAPAEAALALAASRDAVSRGIVELRRSVSVLRDEPGGQTLAERIRSLARLTPGIHAEVAVEGEPGPRSPSLEFVIYRAVQEGLTNASKHAPGCHVHVRLHQGPDRLAVTVADDGRGCDRLAPGHGLRGLAERVDAVGGDLHVDCGPGRGVTLRVEIGAAA